VKQPLTFSVAETKIFLGRFREHRFGFLQDGDVRVGVFSKSPSLELPDQIRH
jgi:hypothetical protein